MTPALHREIKHSFLRAIAVTAFAAFILFVSCDRFDLEPLAAVSIGAFSLVVDCAMMDRGSPLSRRSGRSSPWMALLLVFLVGMARVGSWIADHDSIPNDLPLADFAARLVAPSSVAPARGGDTEQRPSASGSTYIVSGE